MEPVELTSAVVAASNAETGVVEVLTSAALKNGEAEGVALLPNAPNPAGGLKTEGEVLMAEKALDPAGAVASLKAEGVVGAFGSTG